MKNETKFFLFGILFLVIAMLSITFAPPLIKKIFNITFNQYLFIQFEFMSLFLCGVCFTFSPNSYEKQGTSLFVAFFYYLMFVRFYRFMF